MGASPILWIISKVNRKIHGGKYKYSNPLMLIFNQHSDHLTKLKIQNICSIPDFLNECRFRWIWHNCGKVQELCDTERSLPLATSSSSDLQFPIDSGSVSKRFSLRSNCISCNHRTPIVSGQKPTTTKHINREEAEILTLVRTPRVDGNDLRLLRDIDKRSSRRNSPTAKSMQNCQSQNQKSR